MPNKSASFANRSKHSVPAPMWASAGARWCWTRSAAKYYSHLDAWGPILKAPGITFINLQYGDCREEIARAEERHGVKIHMIEGLDLKNDIDGAAALSSVVDLMISAPDGGSRDRGRGGHRNLVPDGRAHLAATRHRRISLVSQKSCVQPGEIRRLVAADVAGRQELGRVHPHRADYCCCCCCW